MAASNTQELTTTVAELREGDEFHAEGRYHYTVEGVERDGGIVAATVRYVDGGTGQREWADASTPITVRRPS